MSQRYRLSHRDPAAVSDANPFGWVSVAEPGYVKLQLPTGGFQFVHEKNAELIRAAITEVNISAQATGGFDPAALRRMYALIDADTADDPETSNTGGTIDEDIRRAISLGYGSNPTPEDIERARAGIPYRAPDAVPWNPPPPTQTRPEPTQTRPAAPLTPFAPIAGGAGGAGDMPFDEGAGGSGVTVPTWAKIGLGLFATLMMLHLFGFLRGR